MKIPASAAAVAVAALAFFLRAYRLADKNIWWDEGWTIWLSQHDLAWIALRTASDEHPPLHYWLMHFWNLVAGTDVFAGRFFSLCFGVLMVALLYRVGKQVGGRALGLLAALLLALARFQVWWSQDIKNYTLSAFFALASVWFTLEIVARYNPRPSRNPRGEPAARPDPAPPFIEGRNALLSIWPGYAFSIALALYSHYLATLVFLADNLFILIFLLTEWRAGRRPLALLLKWSAAQIGALALFAPWLALYLSNAATWSAAPAFDFGLFLRLAATVLSLGVTTYIDDYAWVVAVLTAIAALGALWLLPFVRHRLAARPAVHMSLTGWGALLALLLVLVPPVLIYVLSLTPAAFFAPKIQARYLLILLPGYSLLLALGLLLLGRAARRVRPARLRPFARGVAPLAVVFVVAAQSYTLNAYMQERVLRDEYATLANVVNAFARPDDAVILDTDQEWPTFLYYLRSPLVWVGVPNGAPVDAATARRVAAQVEGRPAVWVVTIPDALEKDPQRLVEKELGRRLNAQYEQTFGDKRLTLYAAQPRALDLVPAENFAPQYARSLAEENGPRLLGFDLPLREARPGDTVRLVTYWSAAESTSVEARLLRAEHSVWRVEVQQTSPLAAGPRVRVESDLLIPPETPPGPVRLTVKAGLLHVELGTLQVLSRPAAASATAAMTALNYALGDAPGIQLLGYTLPTRQFRPGDSVPLTLFWKTAARQSTSYTVFVHLLGSQYNPAQDNFLWGQVDRLPREGNLPTTAWPSGAVIADPYAVPVEANAPPGRYRLEVGMYDRATGARLAVRDRDGKPIGDSIVFEELEIQ